MFKNKTATTWYSIYSFESVFYPASWQDGMVVWEFAYVMFTKNLQYFILVRKARAWSKYFFFH